jgi:hypothetical protein
MANTQRSTPTLPAAAADAALVGLLVAVCAPSGQCGQCWGGVRQRLVATCLHAHAVNGGGRHNFPPRSAEGRLSRFAV